jgi:hypothetical protein
VPIPLLVLPIEPGTPRFKSVLAPVPVSTPPPMEVVLPPIWGALLNGGAMPPAVDGVDGPLPVAGGGLPIAGGLVVIDGERPVTDGELPVIEGVLPVIEDPPTDGPLIDGELPAIGGAPPVINGVLPVPSGVPPLIDEPPATPGALPLIDEDVPPAAPPLVCAKTGAVSASAPATTKHDRMSIVIASSK